MVGEVGAEAECAGLVVAAGAAGAVVGEARREPLGVGPVLAGRMPGSLFPAGDRVEALVHDGVVAVALAGDVALHW